MKLLRTDSADVQIKDFFNAYSVRRLDGTYLDDTSWANEKTAQINADRFPGSALVKTHRIQYKDDTFSPLREGWLKETVIVVEDK
ncbi:hypothetical protein [Myxococcus phage Mx1]|nr:hypothetical protein [Myxococcus phage Mx1]